MIRWLVLASVTCASYAALLRADSGPAIAAAARADNLPAVRALILKKADVNARQADGSPALLWAAYNDNSDMAKALVAAGARVDAANQYGMTPLIQAATSGDVPVMEVLLNGGANPKLARPDAENPLMAAARAGSVPAVKLLLARGADVNGADPFQQETAMMWAAAEGHVDVVKALLAAGGNPNLHAHVTTLTERKNEDHPAGGFTALMFAARNGHADVCEALIKGGADPKLSNGDDANGLSGVTATIIAIANDRLDLAKQLVELGADPNDGSLYFAVDAHDATTDMRARDGSKLRPHHVNRLTSIDLINFLLDKGADPNKGYVGQLHSNGLGPGDFHSASPFYKAAMQSDVDVIKIMLARGAKLDWVPGQVNVPNAGRGANANFGRPALFVAMGGGKGAAFGAGPGFSRQGPPPFREAGDRNPAEAVKLLIKAGADPNVWSWPDNSPPIHKAVSLGNLDVIKALAAAGAQLDAIDNDGNTPLQIAEQNNTPEAIKKAEEAIVAAIANGTPVPAKGAPPQEVVNLLRELQHMPPEAPKPATVEGGTK
ncbi:MAG TPA: ankyrin repeat domain-containing protein [Vicinamibacterales bacterium]|nr:ankyrin repeat domain-containing protein [Vicinamibacterales bacterium]